MDAHCIKRAPRQAHNVRTVVFSDTKEANELINDLEAYPHAYVLACLMNRQVDANTAWTLPYKFRQRFDSFDFEKMAPLSLDDIYDLFRNPAPLHRYTEMMAEIFHSGVRHIEDIYDGDASGIWSNNPSSAEVVSRFLQFEGVGPKIATMAANILAREFKVAFSDYYSIDISVDVHIKRVMKRLGLVPNNPTDTQIIYKARAINPEFPGLIDLPCWKIGKEWCRPTNPKCNECLMNALCPTSNQ